VFEKSEGALHDWEIFTQLASVWRNCSHQAAAADAADQIMDVGLQSGPYGAMEGHELKLSIKKLKENPTASIWAAEIATARAAVSREQAHQRGAAGAARRACRFGEALRQSPDDMSSCASSVAVMCAATIPGCTTRTAGERPAAHQLLMNPADLATRALKDGARVRVRSRVGEVIVEVQASDE